MYLRQVSWFKHLFCESILGLAPNFQNFITANAIHSLGIQLFLSLQNLFGYFFSEKIETICNEHTFYVNNLPNLHIVLWQSICHPRMFRTQYKWCCCSGLHFCQIQLRCIKSSESWQLGKCAVCLPEARLIVLMDMLQEAIMYLLSGSVTCEWKNGSSLW